MVLPILISVAVTPGVSAAAIGPITARAGSAAADSNDVFPIMCPLSLSLLMPAKIDVLVPWPRRDQPGYASGQLTDEAGHARRHQIDEDDEHDAVERSGRRRRVVAGDVGHELDEGRAEEDAEDRGGAADDDADQEPDGQEDVEAVRRDE